MLGSYLSELLSGMVRELERGSGPVKWCRRCGRKHPRRARCGLRTVEVEAKSGRMVTRQRHVSRDPS